MAKAKTTLSDKFNLRGLWWLPGKDDDKIPGNLEWDPNGPSTLELDGSLSSPIQNPTQIFRPDLVFGECITGEKCTLILPIETNTSLNSPGWSASKFRINEITVGPDFIDAGEETFESAEFTMTDLSGWLNRRPFVNPEISSDISTSKIQYNFPEIERFDIPSLQAKIAFSARIDGSYQLLSRSIQHTDMIRIEPKKPKDKQWYLDISYKLRILFTMLVGRPVMFKSFKLCISAEQTDDKDPKWIREYVQFCFKQAGTFPKDEWSIHQIPFHYKVIQSELQSILTKWFEKTDELKTVYTLFFSLNVDHRTPTEFQFLAVMQSLEAYHRTKCDGEYLSREDYESIKKTLIDAIPHQIEKSHRQSLKSRIAYGYEYSLRKRLHELLESIPDNIRKEITHADRKFESKVIDTRNFLTHRDHKSKGVAVEMKEMFELTMDLLMMIHYFLLKEVGLSDEILREVMTEHRVFKNRPSLI